MEYQQDQGNKQPAKKLSNKYNYTQSPFYNLKSKSKLASILQINLKTLKYFVNQNNKRNYHVYPKEVGKKIRQIEEPKQNLKKIHKRIRDLLSRIAIPDYLYSSVKNRGYKANAQKHLGYHPAGKIDLKNFYPSTIFRYVYNFFHKQMECEPDIAYCLAVITTFDGHIPTGSPLSDILTYFAHKPMFDRLENLSIEHNLTLTIYVDDIVISGPTINWKIKRNIERIIHNWGLEYHKVRFYTAYEAKYITGVIIKGHETKLPNNRHLKIHEARKKLKENIPNSEKKATIRSYIGRVKEAEAIDQSIAAKNYLSLIENES